MAIPALYTNFSGGLNTKNAPYLLDEGLGALPARDLNNVQSTLAGAIVKRNGLTTFATPAGACTSLFPFEAISPSVLVGATGTTLISVGSGGAVTTIKTGLANNARWEFVSAPVVSGQGPLYGMNGVDTPQRWDGIAGATSNWTNASGAVAVPNGKYCVYANNQVFVSGVTGAPSSVFWSAIADPTNWDSASLTGAGSAQFDPNDGQAITGIGKVGPYILVTKPRKLWVIIDPATATIRRISDQIGCVAHRTIQGPGPVVFFLSEDRGIYETNGSTLTPLADAIQPTVDLIDGQKQNAAATYFNGHYFLSVAGTGSGPNDATLDYDTTLQSWWRHTFGSNQFAIWHPVSSAQLFSAKATAGIIDRAFDQNVTTDNGANFTWVWRGPWQSPSFYRRRLFPTPFYRKRLRQIRIDGQGTVDLSLAKDFAGLETLVASNALSATATDTFAGGGTFAGDGIFGDVAIKRARYSSLGVANAFSVVLGATSVTQDQVYSLDLMFHDRVDQVVYT